MQRRQKNKAREGDNLLTAEFTTGQLVLGISVSLFLLLVAFMLGMLVANYDSPLTTTDQVADNTERVAAPTAEKTDTASAKPKDTPTKRGASQQGKSGNQGPKASPPTPVLKPVPSASYTPPSPQPKVSAVELKPLPSTSAQIESKITLTKNTAKVEKKKADLIPDPKVTTVSSKGPPLKESLSPVTPTQTTVTPETTKSAPPSDKIALASPTPTQAVNTQNLSTPKQAPTASTRAKTAPKKVVPPPPPPQSKRGKFGIQVAAFLGAERQARAEEYTRLMKTVADIDSAIVPSEDGKVCRI
jgi:hypothetical protein